MSFIASDTHSIDERPPMMEEALTLIEQNFGQDVKLKLIGNSKSLLEKILEESKLNAKNKQLISN